MAGSSKGKSSKKKGKPNRSRPDAASKEHGDISDGTKESKMGGKAKDLSLATDAKRSMDYKPDGAAREFYQKMAMLYSLALEKLLSLNYSMDIALKALLMNGSIFGSSSIFDNIVNNCIAVIHKGLEGEPVFEDMSELITFSMQTLINMVTKDRPNLKNSDAIEFLVSNKSLFTGHMSGECSRSKDESKGASSTPTGSKSKLDEASETHRLLKETSINLRRMNIHSTQQSVAHSEEGISPLADPKANLEGINIEEWLRNSSDEQKVDMMMELANEVHNLEAQLKDRKEWAEEKVVKTAKRLSDDVIEIRKLRLEKFRRERLNKAKEEQAEDGLRGAYIEAIRLNESLKNIESDNEALKADISASQLNTSENENALRLAEKKERRSQKKLTDTENQVTEITNFIELEKQRVSEAEASLVQAVEAEKQAKLRLRQEREAKEQARFLYLEEERLNRKAKEASKKRLAAVRQELDATKQRYMDEILRLERELSELKNSIPNTPSYGGSSASAPSAGGGAAAAGGSSSKPKRRLCIICREKDANIVFRPCCHEVICAGCDDEVFDSLENECPCCNVKIEKRIRVYGPMM